MTEKQQQNLSHGEDFNQRFEEFYKETVAMAYRQAQSILGGNHLLEAQDIVQEAYERYYIRLHTHNEFPKNAQAYLLVIIRNIIYDHTRREERQRIIKSISLEEDAFNESSFSNEIVDPNTPEQLLEDAERQDIQQMAILKAISTLSAGEKQVLALYLKGYKVNDIAKHLCVPFNTAKSRLRRSMNHIIESARHELQSSMDA